MDACIRVARSMPTRGTRNSIDNTICDVVAPTPNPHSPARAYRAGTLVTLGIDGRRGEERNVVEGKEVWRSVEKCIEPPLSLVPLGTPRHACKRC